MNVSLKQVPAEGFINRLVLFLLVHMTNAHGKRILFLASLYYRIVRLDEMREEALGKLNAMLNLARNEKALRMPWAVRDIVWSNGDSLSNLINAEMDASDPTTREAKIQSLCEQIVDGASPGLRYAAPETMIQDVHDMLSQVFVDRSDIPNAEELVLG
jgi:hypothetical protein